MEVKREKEPEPFKTLSHCQEAEEYFYKKDRALIRPLRETADRKRRERDIQQRKAWHWMKCPKCGRAMQEIDLCCVKVDRCEEGHDIYFDGGELEIFTRMPKKAAHPHKPPRRLRSLRLGDRPEETKRSALDRVLLSLSERLGENGVGPSATDGLARRSGGLTFGKKEVSHEAGS